MTRKNGIDVSHWQGLIDWELVSKDNIEFCIIRVGAGTKRDTKFSFNIKNALSAGLNCGIYIYSKATSTLQAQAEADFVLRSIKPYNITYPVYYDIEDDCHLKLTKKERTSIIKAFCDKIADSHYIPGVYASASWFRTMFDLNGLKKYEKWVASWNSNSPNYDGAYGMWQYSNLGTIQGIQTAVDLNYCYKEYETYPQNLKKGRSVVLTKVPLYSSATTKHVSSYVNGTYYIYDGILRNNRLRITNRKDRVGKLPLSTNVTGYVNYRNLFS